MGIYATDLRELVIRPTLYQLDDWSPAAENLLLGTAAQESQLGFRMQMNDQACAGLYGISAQTHTQIWDEFLIHNPELASLVRGLASQHQFLKFPHHELITNLSYATGIAWMVYKRQALPLPEEENPNALAAFWLNCYASRDKAAPIHPLVSDVEQQADIRHGETLIDEFIGHYQKLVLCEERQLAA